MIKVETTIESAGVYRRGAEIAKKGRAQLAEGTQTLEISGLSPSSLADTARLFAAGGLMCSNMRVVWPDRSEDEDSEYSRLAEEQDLLSKKIEAKRLQLKLWKDNGDFSGRNGLSAAEIQEYIEKLGGRVMDLETDIKGLEKELAKVQKKLGEISGLQNSPKLKVDITAPRAGLYALELRFHETSAGWDPVWEIHSDAEGPLDIKLRAKIWQNSPEDWQNVRLSLFTGDPSTSGSLPRLDPVYLDIREPMPAPRMMSARASKMAMGAANLMVAEESAPMAMYDEADMTVEEPTERLYGGSAEVRTDDTMTEYSLPGVRNVPRNDGGTIADLQSFSVPAEYRVSAVPALDLSAYLTARIKAQDMPFLSPVSAAVYLKGMYTGDVYIDPELTEDFAELSLGREERVKLSHRELARKSSSALLKNQKTVLYSFEIKAANLSEQKLEVFIKGRVPVSQNKDISVETVELSGAKLEEKTGLLGWDISLESGETKTLAYSYKVMLPKDKEIRERG